MDGCNSTLPTPRSCVPTIHYYYPVPVVRFLPATRLSRTIIHLRRRCLRRGRLYRAPPLPRTRYHTAPARGTLHAYLPLSSLTLSPTYHRHTFYSPAFSVFLRLSINVFGSVVRAIIVPYAPRLHAFVAAHR